MDLEALLQLLQDNGNLQQLSFDKILTLIMRPSLLKCDIMQPQPLSMPTDMAPQYLLPSVSHFLANSLDIQPEDVQECWKIFKDVIWDHPTAEKVKQADKDAFKLHGMKCGLSEHLTNTIHFHSHSQFTAAGRTIYPDQHCCINPVC
jgi:hypothetical protein